MSDNKINNPDVQTNPSKDTPKSSSRKTAFLRGLSLAAVFSASVVSGTPIEYGSYNTDQSTTAISKNGDFVKQNHHFSGMPNSEAKTLGGNSDSPEAVKARLADKTGWTPNDDVKPFYEASSEPKDSSYVKRLTDGFWRTLGYDTQSAPQDNCVTDNSCITSEQQDLAKRSAETTETKDASLNNQDMIQSLLNNTKIEQIMAENPQIVDALQKNPTLAEILAGGKNITEALQDPKAVEGILADRNLTNTLLENPEIVQTAIENPAILNSVVNNEQLIENCARAVQQNDQVRENCEMALQNTTILETIARNQTLLNQVEQATQNINQLEINNKSSKLDNLDSGNSNSTTLESIDARLSLILQNQQELKDGFHDFKQMRDMLISALAFSVAAYLISAVNGYRQQRIQSIQALQ